MASIINTLSELAYGQAVSEYDQALTDLVAAVEEHGKSGSFVLTLKFTPDGNNRSQIVIADAFKVSTPEADRMNTIMYRQRDGSLSRRDPRQPELPMREVVNPATGEVTEEHVG